MKNSRSRDHAELISYVVCKNVAKLYLSQKFALSIDYNQHTGRSNLLIMMTLDELYSVRERDQILFF